MCLRPGIKAPEFEIQAYFPDGKVDRVSLSDYKGKWLIIFFYPADFTFVWPTEMAAVAAVAKELKNLNTEVLAISIDTVFVHKVWQEVELSKLIPGGFPFPMGSDLGGKIGTLYGVYDEKTGVNLRGTFLIDPEGIIRVMQIYDAPIGRNFDEMIRMIKASQHVRATQGTEACPANWKPGKSTLKPAPELAGKVYEIWNPSNLDN